MKNRQNNNPINARSLLRPVARLAAPAVALLLCLAASPALADDGDDHERRVPDLPSPACDTLNVPAANKVSFHAYALGVQIYHWDGTAWKFDGPDAALFADQCYDEQVGIHYADQGNPMTPAWQSQSGSSKVVGARQAGCTPYRGAIPWLRLGASQTSGRGIFGHTTYIQRVNTIGGTAPAEAGTFVGDLARVPYTAEYYFYRASKH